VWSLVNSAWCTYLACSAQLSQRKTQDSFCYSLTNFLCKFAFRHSHHSHPQIFCLLPTLLCLTCLPPCTLSTLPFMPIHPVPFITLKLDPNKTNGTSEHHEDGTEGEEHYNFEINPEAAKMLQSIEEPVSVCFPFFAAQLSAFTPLLFYLSFPTFVFYL
jgi:hypothetical protein